MVIRVIRLYDIINIIQVVKLYTLHYLVRIRTQVHTFISIKISLAQHRNGYGISVARAARLASLILFPVQHFYIQRF